ncbi:DUF2490 domain-containing protein [Mangrovibacterium lignilyticum]|uniref:DUF2490 domain-containing protein n=1 Tax=Mangrovibacterium lignilyticum TaxID=2668052 RepID=UPI0013D2675A|nr:DUF2490 domain-containing protein [Mangrovibacterium lignilyticum]
MRKIQTVTILLFFLLPTAVKVHAQTKDFGAWFGFELEKELKDWAFSLAEEVRSVNNLNDLHGLYTTLGVDYKLSKRFKIGTSYQFIYFNDTEYDDFQPRHRLNLFATGNVKWNHFKFSLRERLQTTFKDESERDYKMNPKIRWRSRFELEYNIPKSKFTPAFSVETYYQLNNPDGNKFDQIRYKLSGSYKLNKRNELSLYGQLYHEINVKNPVDLSVVGVEYKFKLKDKKNKE